MHNPCMGLVELVAVAMLALVVLAVPCLGEGEGDVADSVVSEPYKAFPLLRRPGQVDVQYLQNAIGWYYVLVTGVACLAAAIILVSIVRMCVHVCRSTRGYHRSKKSA